MNYKKERVVGAIGVRKDRFGFEAYVKVGKKQLSKRFPLTATMGQMQTWRTLTARELELSKEHPIAALPTLKSMPGWCYIYFIRVGERVKIGRAKDVNRRLGELRPGSAQPLNLIAAVPSHGELESAIHEKFAKYRIQGEWFALSPELTAFIELLKRGVNPVALLFDPEFVRSWEDELIDMPFARALRQRVESPMFQHE